MTTTPTVWLEEQQANTTDSGTNGDDQTGIQLVGLGNGTFVALWESNTDDGAGAAGGTDIIGQLYNAEGVKIGGEFRANQGFFADDEGDFTAAALPGGGFVIAYEDTDVNGTAIRYNVLDANGVVQTTGTIAADPGAQDVGAPSVSVQTDGSFLVTYQQRDAGANTTATFGTFVDSSGVAGSPFLLLAGNLSDDVGANGQQVDVQAIGSGRYAIVSRALDGDNGFFMRVINGDGSNVLGFTEVGATIGNGQSDVAPALAAIGGGGYVVVWQNSDANDTDVLFQRYDVNGVAQGGLVAVNGPGTTDNNVAPDVVGLSDGGFAIVYDDNEANTIVVQRYDQNGVAVGVEHVVTSGGSKGNPTITLSDDGRLLVGYTQSVFTGGLNFDNDVFVEIDDPRENIFSGDGTSETITSRRDGADVSGLGGNDTLLGQESGDTLRGGDGDDSITGREGDDLIEGGFNADTLIGGAGDDTIFAMTEADQDGSSVADSILGGAGFDFLLGSAANDTLSGGIDDDTLDGGAGDDLLLGGAGNDTLIFNSGDGGTAEVTDGGSGSDRLLVQSTFNFSTRDLISIEELEFDASVTLARTATFAAEQFGSGFSASGTIDFAAVGAAEVLNILMGTDTILNLSNLTIQDFDSAGTENDRIRVQGDGDDEVVLGSDVADIIIGAGGADTLNGGGGVDVLQGGAGDDNYQVDTQGEAVEGANQGIDLVRSTVTYTLGANLENLTLLDTASIDAVGNTLDNRLTGNDGVNTLRGRQGNDTLTGDGGDDRFVFDSVLNPNTNVDTITDFNIADDRFRLDDARFAGIGPIGGLTADAFRNGNNAADAEDRIIYNSANGNVWFDSDGVGGAQKILFAKVDPGTALAANDFFVF